MVLLEFMVPPKKKMKQKTITMTTFKVGDKAEVLDDTTKGVIVQINKDKIILEVEEGFQVQYMASELIKVSESESISVTNYEVARIKNEKADSIKKQSFARKPKLRNAPAMEVDLHIHKLLKSTKGMGNYELMNKQLEVAKHQLEFAIRKRIQKIVFIHGVGQGVLKEELYTLFRRYDTIKFYDADYQKYGLGATEVYIYQNP